MQCNVKDFSLNIDKPEYKSQVLSTIPAISAKSQETIDISLLEEETKTKDRYLGLKAIKRYTTLSWKEAADWLRNFYSLFF